MFERMLHGNDLWITHSFYGFWTEGALVIAKGSYTSPSTGYYGLDTKLPPVIIRVLCVLNVGVDFPSGFLSPPLIHSCRLCPCHQPYSPSYRFAPRLFSLCSFQQSMALTFEDILLA